MKLRYFEIRDKDYSKQLSYSFSLYTNKELVVKIDPMDLRSPIPRRIYKCRLNHVDRSNRMFFNCYNEENGVIATVSIFFNEVKLSITVTYIDESADIITSLFSFQIDKVNNRVMGNVVDYLKEYYLCHTTQEVQ